LRSRHLLLTGSPGCGKTTLLVRFAARVAELHRAGFYTEEVRVAGIRQGFRLVGLDGSEGMLAHVRCRSRQRVGRYGVDVAGFETFLDALDLQGSTAPLVFIDEIGKMECLSPQFVGMMRELFDSGKKVIATVALRGSGFIAEVKARSDCEVVTIDPGNRERILPELFRRLHLPSVDGG